MALCPAAVGGPTVGPLRPLGAGRWGPWALDVRGRRPGARGFAAERPPPCAPPPPSPVAQVVLVAGLCGAEEAWQDAAPPPPRPGTVTEARRVVAALADVPEAQVDAAMDAAQRRCPRWGRAVALVKRRRFAEAVPLFRAALVAQNAGLVALLGPEEVLRPWVEHYALVLLGIEGLGPVLPLGAAAAEEGLPGPPRVALRAVQLRDAAYEELKVRYVRAPWSTGPCGAGGGALGPEAHGNAGVTAFRGPGLWGRGGGGT